MIGTCAAGGCCLLFSVLDSFCTTGRLMAGPEVFVSIDRVIF